MQTKHQDVFTGNMQIIFQQMCSLHYIAEDKQVEVNMNDEYRELKWIFLSA